MPTPAPLQSAEELVQIHPIQPGPHAHAGRMDYGTPCSRQRCCQYGRVVQQIRASESG